MIGDSTEHHGPTIGIVLWKFPINSILIRLSISQLGTFGLFTP